MDCIDLGFDYFLIKFELREDVDNILKGGPWFIGKHFLAIRQWEPEFKASSAMFSSVAMWIRLPELPIQFYEQNALLKIGIAIGPVLRIDAHTANGVRGDLLDCVCQLTSISLLSELFILESLNRAFNTKASVLFDLRVGLAIKKKYAHTLCEILLEKHNWNIVVMTKLMTVPSS